MVTFKDLRKRINNPIIEQQSKPLFQRLRNKRFWFWDEDRHRQARIVSFQDCCFNHIIGLPRKEGIEKPIFDYQKLLYDNLMIPSALLLRSKNIQAAKDRNVSVTVLTPMNETAKKIAKDIEDQSINIQIEISNHRHVLLLHFL